MKILVTEEVPGESLEALAGAFNIERRPDLWRHPPALRRAAGKAHALVIRNQTRIDAALLAAAPHLQVVGRVGVGLDNVDVDACERAGVVVAYTPEENALSVAELVFALLLGLARRIVESDRTTKAGNWDRQGAMGVELYGRTLGLIGLGKIGTRVAIRARAFGMKVIAFDPYLLPHSLPVTESGASLVGLDELIARADVISLHVPLTPSTRGLIDAPRMAAMKPGAIVINTARGGLVDEEALADALISGHLGGAALDVRAEEPPAPGRLERCPNVILTPHAAAMTVEAQARVLASVAADVRRVLEGQPARQAVGRSRPRNRELAGSYE